MLVAREHACRVGTRERHCAARVGYGAQQTRCPRALPAFDDAQFDATVSYFAFVLTLCRCFNAIRAVAGVPGLLPPRPAFE